MRMSLIIMVLYYREIKRRRWAVEVLKWCQSLPSWEYLPHMVKSAERNKMFAEYVPVKHMMWLDMFLCIDANIDGYLWTAINLLLEERKFNEHFLKASWILTTEWNKQVL